MKPPSASIEFCYLRVLTLETNIYIFSCYGDGHREHSVYGINVTTH